MAGTNLLTDESAILDECEQLGCLLENGYPSFDDLGTEIQAINTEKMTADFVIVARNERKPNRHNTLVQIAANKDGEGLMTENFARNPCVLFGHGMMGMPFGGMIGSAADENGRLHLTKTATRATSRAHFSQSLPDAAVVFSAIAEGMFRAASVQFMPFKAKRFQISAPKNRNDDADVMDFQSGSGLDFLSSDLYEWSVVPIGADPDALRKSLDRGNIGGEKLTASIKRILTAACEPRKLAVPGFDIRELVRQRLEPVIVRQAALNRKYANVLGLTDVPAI